jgi:hypothetical protein
MAIRMIGLEGIGGDDGKSTEENEAGEEQYPPWGKSFHGIDQVDENEGLDQLAAKRRAS